MENLGLNNITLGGAGLVPTNCAENVKLLDATRPIAYSFTIPMDRHPGMPRAVPLPVPGELPSTGERHS